METLEKEANNSEKRQWEKEETEETAPIDKLIVRRRERGCERRDVRKKLVETVEYELEKKLTVV